MTAERDEGDVQAELERLKAFVATYGATFDFMSQYIETEGKPTARILALRYRTQNGVHDMTWIVEGPPEATKAQLLQQAIKDSQGDATLLAMLACLGRGRLLPDEPACPRCGGSGTRPPPDV